MHALEAWPAVNSSHARYYTNTTDQLQHVVVLSDRNNKAGKQFSRRQTSSGRSPLPSCSMKRFNAAARHQNELEELLTFVQSSCRTAWTSDAAAHNDTVCT